MIGGPAEGADVLSRMIGFADALGVVKLEVEAEGSRG